MKLRTRRARTTPFVLCALALVIAAFGSGCADDSMHSTAPKRAPKVPDQIEYAGDVCVLVTPDEAAALLGETVTVEDAPVATETTFCFYDGATQRLSIAAEEYGSAHDARRAYWFRDPSRHATKVRDVGDLAYRSAHAASEATGNTERVDLTILSGRFIVSLNRTQPVDQPAFSALARTALGRLPA